jgi:hypothetical protein
MKGSSPWPDQALRELFEALEALSGEHDADAFMTDQALTTAADWEEIRVLAAVARATRAV